MTELTLKQFRLHKLDKLLTPIILILLTLAVVAPQQALATLKFTAESLLLLAPALMLAVALSAWVKASSADRIVSRVFSGRMHAAIWMAALFGALSPFCSCGVIPLVLALLQAGIPLAPVMAFWLSSPLMDPQLFIITASTLGLPFAIVKTGSAVMIALLGGYLTLALTRKGFLTNPLRNSVAKPSCVATSTLKDQPIVWKIWHTPERLSSFKNEFLKTGGFLLKIMTLAFVLESLMLSWIPAESVASVLGSDNQWAIVLATFIGVPAYLNSLAAIPLVSGLMEMGMAPGAALAFLTAGAISSIPAAAAVYAIARLRIFVSYLVFAFAGSILVGWAYQFGLQVFG